MTTTTKVTTTGRTGLAGPRALRVAGTVTAGLAVWVLAAPLLGVELTARSGDTLLTVGPVSVAGAGLLAGLGGWGLLALLERLTTHARTVWVVTTSVVLVLSFTGPLIQATTTAAALSLAAMHLAVGMSVILSMGPTARPHPRT